MAAIVKQQPATKRKGVPVEQSTTSSGIFDTSMLQPFWDNAVPLPDGGETGFDMYGIEGDLYAPNPWDCITLGGHRLPGWWSAVAKPSIQIDIQKPKGLDGAALVIRGYNPAKNITLTGHIWTPAQWAIYQGIFPTLWNRPDKVSAQSVVLGKQGKVGTQQTDQGEVVGEQRSLSIVNPAINQLGIHTIVITAPSTPEPGDQPGEMKIILTAVEYVPAPKVSKSAVKSVKGQQDTRKPGALTNKINGALAANGEGSPAKTTAGP